MKLLVAVIGILIIVVGFLFFYDQETIIPVGKNTTTPTIQPATPTPTVIVKIPPETYVIPQKLQVFQTFNNCGPASLSMLLSYYNQNVTQQELGLKLRPWQNPQGDNDDKSVTLEELAIEAQNYNLISYHRPNGNVDLLKKFIANGMPVLVRTWLHPNEDIGHYRIVRGYYDTTGEIIQDDSYEGKDLRYTYQVFSEMWKPFNYEYVVVVTPENTAIAEAIIGEDVSEHIAWERAYTNAVEEEKQNSNSLYAVFNQSIAAYHLGRYQESIQKFEQVQYQLPSRTLWYQIEPLQAYLETKQYDELFARTNFILNNYNRGFSELYLLRGRAYLDQGNREAARIEFQNAVFYNQNLEEAKQELAEVSL